MTDAPQKVGGLFDGILGLLLNNSELPADLRAPLAAVNEAMQQSVSATVTFNAASDQIAKAAQDWQAALTAFEKVLAKYGVPPQ